MQWSFVSGNGRICDRGLHDHQLIVVLAQGPMYTAIANRAHTTTAEDRAIRDRSVTSRTMAMASRPITFTLTTKAVVGPVDRPRA